MLVSDAETSQTALYRAAMTYRPETPFDSIESALEYMSYLLEATQEAQKQVDSEIEHSADHHLARRKQAMELVSYKLTTLASHVSRSRHLLRDLRTLRRLLLEERGDSKRTESQTG